MSDDSNPLWGIVFGAVFALVVLLFYEFFSMMLRR